jgi:hypothetical protein
MPESHLMDPCRRHSERPGESDVDIRLLSNAFGANLRSDDGMLVVEFLEDIVFGDDSDA